MMGLDSLGLPDSLKYETKLRGRTIGGGGIVPDVFVPLDTTDNSAYFSSILRKGLDNRYALTYVDSLRAEWKRPPTRRRWPSKVNRRNARL